MASSGCGWWWARWAAALIAALAMAALARAAEPVAPNLSVQGWIERLHEATRARAYSGTFVVTRGDDVVSARVVHACDGQRQVERIENLSGPARVTWRLDDEVLTLWPQQQTVLRERRETLRLFPGPVKVPGVKVDEHYRAELRGRERVAGLEAWVVEFVPRDGWRYGYRLWSELRTGLALKMQTLGAGQQVLEQMAYTEVQLDAPLKVEGLLRQMEDTRGWRTLRPQRVKTNPQALGWRWVSSVPGFQLVGCWQREAEAGRGRPPLQCVVSDGLASVSLFLGGGEPPHANPRASGAMQVRAGKLGEHAVLAIGEVPAATLERLLAGVERAQP
ncbi:MucB/RseB C-terminal domain-containing protein [Tepidimonas alkaliphilus]|nr:MucB/RseB C-terminal domain-containing protein [Tepidimonas alkaliphilus]